MSVVASVLGAAIALFFGVTASFLAGVTAYVVATMAVAVATLRSPAVEPAVADTPLPSNQPNCWPTSPDKRPDTTSVRPTRPPTRTSCPNGPELDHLRTTFAPGPPSRNLSIDELTIRAHLTQPPHSRTGESWPRRISRAPTPTRLVRTRPEGIDVKPLYTAADVERPRRRHAAGLPAVHPRRAGHHVRQPAVDDPPVRRLLHRRGVERVLPAQPGRPGSRACRWPSTSPPTGATTRTTRGWRATSARPAWPSTPSRT